VLVVHPRALDLGDSMTWRKAYTWSTAPRGQARWERAVCIVVYHIPYRTHRRRQPQPLPPPAPRPPAAWHSRVALSARAPQALGRAPLGAPRAAAALRRPEPLPADAVGVFRNPLPQNILVYMENADKGRTVAVRKCGMAQPHRARLPWRAAGLVGLDQRVAATDSALVLSDELLYLLLLLRSGGDVL
jgi:hypothetical protein